MEYCKWIKLYILLLSNFLKISIKRWEHWNLFSSPPSIFHLRDIPLCPLPLLSKSILVRLRVWFDSEFWKNITRANYVSLMWHRLRGSRLWGRSRLEYRVPRFRILRRETKPFDTYCTECHVPFPVTVAF